MVETGFPKGATYRSLYRNKELALSGLGGLVAAMLVTIALALVFLETGSDALPVILTAIAVTVVGLIVIMLVTPRTHSWTIEEAGLRIEEGPKVPFMGPRRHAFVPFADVVALRHLESGFDKVIELGTRSGAQYRLMQVIAKPAQGRMQVAVPEPAPSAPTPSDPGPSDPGPSDLQSFAATIVEAVAATGAAPVRLEEALSFWNRGAGLAVIVGFLLLTTALAGLVLWALFDGGLDYRARLGETIAIVVALPFGVAYMLYRALRRRRIVLAGRTGTTA